MKHRPPLFVVALVALAAAGSARPSDFEWDERAAEHLLNRAGFGARGDEVRAAVGAGHEAFVDSLFTDDAGEPFFAQRFSTRDGRAALRERLDDMELDERPEKGSDEARAMRRTMRRDDQRQLAQYEAWWLERMVDGDDPLRERVALFWHGHFTSSMRDVKSSFEMIAQNRLFRELGLGSFRELVHEVARDPAMLEYLDNDANRRGSPNENFARELLELFTLGEGNYTESDVKEIARAFTGWTDRDGEFRFVQQRHDDGEKTIFGRTGRFDGEDVIELVLEQDACARWIAARLLAYFEGRDPSDERVGAYAKILRDADWDVRATLRALFLDPAFYAHEVVGARVASPVDLLVGHARRLDLEPPGALLIAGTRLLGQSLFDPPSVKGWDGGLAWITTSTLMNRGNLAGFLLGVVDFQDVASGAPELRALRRLADRWTPRLHLAARARRAGCASDADVVDLLLDELLAIEPSAELRANVLAFYAGERAAAEIEPGAPPADDVRSEELLRRTAHLVLSLPEAQLH